MPPIAEGMEYTEFRANGESIAGGIEMNSMVPTQVPSYRQVYFSVEDLDKEYKKGDRARRAGGAGAQDFPGGRFSILRDPQGASTGLLKMRQ